MVPARGRRSAGARVARLRKRRRVGLGPLRRRCPERPLAVSVQRRPQLAGRAVGRWGAAGRDDRSRRRADDARGAGGRRSDDVGRDQAGRARSDRRHRRAPGRGPLPRRCAPVGWGLRRRGAADRNLAVLAPQRAARARARIRGRGPGPRRARVARKRRVRRRRLLCGRGARGALAVLGRRRPPGPRNHIWRRAGRGYAAGSP